MPYYINYFIKLHLLFNFLSLILSVNVLPRPYSTNNLTKSSCNLPPDFWCDSPEITLMCMGSLIYCNGYR